MKRLNFNETILYFANQLLVEKMKPKLDLLPKMLLKFGDLMKQITTGVSALCSLVAKLINKMILNILQPKMPKIYKTIKIHFLPIILPTHILAYRRYIEVVKATRLKINISANLHGKLKPWIFIKL